VPKSIAHTVVIVLVTKLNFNAFSACCEKAKLKNSGLIERTKTARIGSKNNPNIKMLGMMNIHFESVSFFNSKQIYHKGDKGSQRKNFLYLRDPL
jgi:hypothetical protein